MNSSVRLPRVLRLEYELLVEDDHPDRYVGSKPVERIVGDFDCDLVDYRLTATPRVHFSDTYDACDEFESDLRGWECYYEIISGTRVRFRFAGGAIEDIDEDTGEPVEVPVITFSGDRPPEPQPIQGTLSESHYPTPPATSFRQSERLEALRGRFRDVGQGRDRLLVFGYFMITAIETDFGGTLGKRRKTAARALNVDLEVLNTVGHLTSERSHDVHGRKAGFPFLTYGEEMFIRTAIKRLLLQIGYIEAGSTPSKLEMSDLPRPEARAPWDG